MAEKKKRGFAAMDENKKREIARKGGIAAHQKGTAHEFTSEEAREAGRKGGTTAHRKGRAHEFTPEEARAAGRKGGLASQQMEAAPAEQEVAVASHPEEQTAPASSSPPMTPLPPKG
jgi:general stress protein YciG